MVTSHICTTLALSFSVSFVIFSVLMFLLGIFLGSLIHRRQCCVKCSSTTQAPHTQVPVYEEVSQNVVVHAKSDACKLEQNVSYGILTSW